MWSLVTGPRHTTNLPPQKIAVIASRKDFLPTILGWLRDPFKGHVTSN